MSNSRILRSSDYFVVFVHFKLLFYISGTLEIGLQFDYLTCPSLILGFSGTKINIIASPSAKFFGYPSFSKMGVFEISIIDDVLRSSLSDQTDIVKGKTRYSVLI